MPTVPASRTTEKAHLSVVSTTQALPFSLLVGRARRAQLTELAAGLAAKDTNEKY